MKKLFAVFLITVSLLSAQSTGKITCIDMQNGYVYNRSNIQSLRWDYKEMKVDDTSSIGILPSIGVGLEF